MAKIAIKEIGKELILVESPEKYRTNACEDYTGKEHRVVYVRLNEEGTLCLAVNEDGIPLQFKTNFYLKLNNPIHPFQKMVGTVCFVRHKYVNVYEEEIWDYEIEDLTDDDLTYINKLLDEDYQKEIEFLYHLLGGY